MMSNSKTSQNGKLLSALALAAVVLMLVYLAGQAAVASAHGEVIEVDPAEAKAGDEIVITGGEFPADEEVELLLEGVRGTVDFGHVEVDGTGVFEFIATIPAGTAAGAYQLVAVTVDDRVTMDYTVLAGGASSGDGGEGETVLTFERSVTETIVIGVLAAIAALVGGVLVYSSRHRSSHQSSAH